MKHLFICILVAISLISCVKEVEEQIVTGSDYTGSDTDLRIRDFIWKGLNQYYLWQEEVSNLQDNRFGKLSTTKAEKNTDYTKFLKSFGSPEALFYRGLLNKYKQIDRFSYITDDYVKLENQFKGISASTGMDSQYVLMRNGVNAAGFVNYVIPNSDADKQGLKRGDIFLTINGQRITKTNINELLKNKTYTIDIYRIDQQGILQPTGHTVTLHNTETPENPVLIKKVITIGQRKIAYLMYNAFIANYNKELNEAFAEFKAAGATDLVLDLRYNGGGSIDTAVYLASMIAGQHQGQLFVKEKWNTKMQAAANLQGATVQYLTDKMKDGTPIHSLQLSKLYVLTTERTASASELVINGLKPYMPITQIGQTTVGKNQGSITIYDYIDKAGKVKNPKHKWAMQPIVLSIENSKGFSDYTKGLVPDIPMEEDLANIGTLGDPAEPFLAEAIAQITGSRSAAQSRRPSTTPFSYEVLTTSKDAYFGYNEMYK